MRTSPHRRLTLAARASRMRGAPTTTEALLWGALRGSRLGVAFRRQVVIGEFIADFCAPSRRLVVEVDGEYHEHRRDADARRDRRLEAAGYRVVHVAAEVVRKDLAAAVEVVRGALGA